MKTLSLLSLLFFGQAIASVEANYFRVWEGFKKNDLSHAKFLRELPQFMSDTVNLYRDNGLSNYIVVMPPKNKPDFIPDELALVALRSQDEYQRVRQTPEGQNYSARHWDVFNKENSKSAKSFINYWQEKPEFLSDGYVYDMIGNPIDWSKGQTFVYIGLKKDSISKTQFLKKLQSHIELVSNVMHPVGLNGYIVIAHDKYEVAYLNWNSKVEFNNAMNSLEGKNISSDGAKIMNALMFHEASPINAGSSINFNATYSTLNN